MTRIITIANEKGGVGKTTTAVALTAAIAEISGRALLADADPQASSADLARAYGDAFGADYTQVSAADVGQLHRQRQAGEYDTIVIDAPGRLDVMAPMLGLADMVLIPCPPEYAAIKPTLRTANLAAAHGTPYLIVATMVDKTRGAGPLEQLWAMLDREGQPRARTFIARRVAWQESQLQGVPITTYHGHGWRDALADLRKLQAETLLWLDRITKDSDRWHDVVSAT
jgi:chromosome partitioning protein